MGWTQDGWACKYEIWIYSSINYLMPDFMNDNATGFCQSVLHSRVECF